MKKHYKSKIAAMTASSAVKILTAVVCGALILTGTYGVITHTVLPNSNARTKALANYEGQGGAGGGDYGDYIMYTEAFNDGPVQSYFYSTLEDAIVDANNNTTANALADVSGAKATIEVKENDGGYIVKPLSDCDITTVQNLSGTYIFDTNGKTLSLASGAEFDIINGANITFRDSGNGKITKNVSTSVSEKVISVPSANTSEVAVTFINGNYKCENNGSGKALVYIESNTNCVSEINNGNFYAYSASESCAGVKAIQLSGNFVVNNGNFVAEINENTDNRGYAMYIGTGATGSVNNAVCKGVGYNQYGICTTTSVNSVIINGGKFYGYRNGIASATINNGQFAAFFTQLGSPSSGATVTVNGGTFSGSHSGVSTVGNVNINGGTFESSWHGGAYFAGNIRAENAIFRCMDTRTLTNGAWIEEQLYLYLKDSGYSDTKDNFLNDFYSSYPNGGQLFATFYVGYQNTDVTVYMNNCKLEGENLRNNIGLVLSSNYGYKNTTLYISNTEVPGKIRVDGVNSGGYKGHLYIGKNVSHDGITGSGVVDTETYKNVSFTEEYVSANFS